MPYSASARSCILKQNDIAPKRGNMIVGVRSGKI